VKNTCASGVLEDYNGTKLRYGGVSPYPVMDYPAIPNAYKVLSGVKIANESATKRSDAVPIAYKLKITQDGLLSLSYSYDGGAYISVLSKQNITNSNGALPSSFRFGFAGSTGGSTNIHEILCFQAAPADQATTSVGINAKEAAKIANGTQAYLAYYYPSNWTGRLTANDLLYDASTQIVSVSATSNWDAQCVLTGVASGKTCPTTGGGATSAEAPSSRTILSWNGSTGIPFQWDKLSTAQQNALDQGDTAPLNSDRLQYLRGDRSNEVDSSGVGLFRARDSVLADIVDSSPSWVGPPSSAYATTWKDKLYSTASPAENSGTQSYAQFSTTMATRLNVVYAGANDGMLHGFRAGSYDSSGNYVDNSTTPNDGEEVLAYVPGAILQSAVSGCSATSANPTDSVVQSIHGVIPGNSSCTPATSTSVDSSVDYSSTQYGHNFTVDGTPGTGDLFYGGTWHTWLAGGLGPGGAALYVLDITNPSNFSESNAASLVIGEWTSSTISCSGDTTCGTNLGDTYGQPVIRRLHNGSWAVIFGNGFGSASGDAGIYIMTVDPTTGSKTFYYLSTGKSGTNDGIAYVSPVDLDRDRIIDYVYAGDLLGNVWRFDLTSDDPSSWSASSTPLFTTPGGQPITTKLTAVVMPSTPQRLMIDFGTGQRTPITNSSPIQYASGTQHLYGIWDWNMSGWNSESSVQYMSLSAPQSIVASGAGKNLVTQTLTESSGELDGTSNTVCWKGTTTCSGGTDANDQFGWVLALPDTNEQVVYNPILFEGAFIVNTTIPASNSLTSCTTNTDTGHTIAISADQGGTITDFFQNYHDAVGFQTNGSGSAFVVNAGGLNHLLTQTTNLGSTSGATTEGPFTCQNGACDSAIHPHGPTGRRLTWAEKR
jgi:type IV pilus assembly protein PilY1